MSLSDKFFLAFIGAMIVSATTDDERHGMLYLLLAALFFLVHWIV